MSTDFTLPLVDTACATLLTGDDFGLALLNEIERAQTRIWANYFIVSMAIDYDPCQRVRQLCDALCRAHRRHVDVRLLIDPFDSPAYPYPPNHVAAYYLHDRDVPVRIYDNTQATHAKYALFDTDTQIVGSGNLTHGGLHVNDEMALYTVSEDLAHWITERFLRHWDAAEALEPLNWQST